MDDGADYAELHRVSDESLDGVGRVFRALNSGEPGEIAYAYTLWEAAK